MSRKDRIAAEGEEAKRRLRGALTRTRTLVAEYRARLLLLRRAEQRRRRLSSTI